MIHARIKHKSGAEDERTALIFGPLLYLPANTLWQILRSSCFDNESMPQKGGELLHYEFWPNYNKTEHTSNESYVEPDLLLEFEYFNLLVEIKRKDVQSYRQYEGQWKNEIQARQRTNARGKQASPINRIGRQHFARSLPHAVGTDLQIFLEQPPKSDLHTTRARKALHSGLPHPS